MKNLFKILIVRLLLLVFFSLLAKKIVPYLGFFPYRELAEGYNLPDFITAWANFDGAHYINIASRGYDTYEQAFFPLYPLVIKMIAPFFLGNLLATGLFLSNFFFVIGFYYLLKWCRDYAKISVLWISFFILTFPTAFFFSMMYTEGLFFMLFFVSLYFIEKKQYKIAVVAAIFASLTKISGVFLVAIFFIHFWRGQKWRNLKSLVIIFSPTIGLLIYSFYLYITTHDPLFFLNSQWAFGANRTSNFVILPQVYFRYLKIFLTTRFDYIYFVALTEISIFTFAFLTSCYQAYKSIKKRNYFELSIAIFSTSVLVLPTLTGTFSSLPRYSLFAISSFIFLSRIKSVKLKLFIGVLFTSVQVILFSMFIQGYFVS